MAIISLNALAHLGKRGESLRGALSDGGGGNGGVMAAGMVTVARAGGSPVRAHTHNTHNISVHSAQLASEKINATIDSIFQSASVPPETSFASRLNSSLIMPDLTGFQPGRDQYDGVMFASSLSLPDTEIMSLRVCTKRCKAIGMHSTIGLGNVVSQGGGRFMIKDFTEEYVEHSDKGEATGPEDARLDVLGNRVFLYFNMPPEAPAFQKCKGYDSGNFRKLHFKWRGEEGVCLLKAPESEPCKTEKNWVSIVPAGSIQPFFVYSIYPLQVFELHTERCKMRQVTGTWEPNPDLQHRGSSRYVKGIEVAEGTIYWALVHSEPGNLLAGRLNKYETFVSVVLVSRQQDKGFGQFKFQLLGTSCALPTGFEELGHHSFAYPSSIISFDPGQDVAKVTFHIDDQIIIRSSIQGVVEFLRTAHSQWLNTGEAFSCQRVRPVLWVMLCAASVTFVVVFMCLIWYAIKASSRFLRSSPPSCRDIPCTSD